MRRMNGLTCVNVNRPWPAWGNGLVRSRWHIGRVSVWTNRCGCKPLLAGSLPGADQEQVAHFVSIRIGKGLPGYVCSSFRASAGLL